MTQKSLRSKRDPTRRAGDTPMLIVDDKDVGFGRAVEERARAAGLPVSLRCFGDATLLMCPEVPRDISFNRAYDIDAREPGVIAAILEATRAANGWPLLEINQSSIGDEERAELTGLGLERLWVNVALRVDLAEPLPPAPSGVPVHSVGIDQAEEFGELALRAFAFPVREGHADMRIWSAFAALSRARCFVAEVDGVMAAVGMSWIADDAAMIDGAATLLEYQRRGCQTALLAARLRQAKEDRAKVAITRTSLGSPSQRNIERAGFSAYRRMEVWGEADPR